MNIIDVILNLFKAFIPYDRQEMPRIEEEARQWYDKIRVDDKPDNKVNPTLIKVKKFSLTWYGFLLGGLAYLMGKKWLIGWISDTEEEIEELSQE